jgi:hypothetical protein
MFTIYIPRISSDNTEATVKAAFLQQIGEVSRVDFANLVATPGVTQTPNRFMKAFVHLNTVYDPSLVEVLDGGGQYRMHPEVNSINARRREIYWILVKNHKPIPETKLNIHQIAENHTLLEKLVMDLANRLNAAEATIQAQAEKIFTLEIANMPSLMSPPSTPPSGLLAFPGAMLGAPPHPPRLMRMDSETPFAHGGGGRHIQFDDAVEVDEEEGECPIQPPALRREMTTCVPPTLRREETGYCGTPPSLQRGESSCDELVEKLFATTTLRRDDDGELLAPMVMEKYSDFCERRDLSNRLCRIETSAAN